MLDFYRFTHFEPYPFLLHAVSTKSNDQPYKFSLALHTGEDAENIVANRQLLSTIFDTDQKLYYIVANQTHSDHIKIITSKETRGWKILEDAIEDCDALITNVPGIVLTILTADCVPILLYDKEKNVIAVIHSGWKGTKAHIAFKTVQKMNEIYGSDPKDIIAGIAPSIGPCCYEVGKEVAEHFFSVSQSFTAVGNKYMLDLPYINKQQLIDAGLQEKQIQLSGICTACEVAQFFSYRKEKGCSGRFMSMIGLKEINEANKNEVQ